MAHDLTSGALFGRLPLPDVVAGVVETEFDQTESSFVFWEHRVPSLAISPDGRRLALVHPDGSAATLIDAKRLIVEEVVQLAKPDPPQPAATGDPPTNATTIGMLASGMTWRVAFAADGSHLYRAGDGSVIVDQRAEIGWTTELERIDLTTGAVVARAPGAGSVVMAVAPDGENLYVYRANRVETETGGMRIEELGIARLDAETLHAQATAPSGLYPPIMVIPA